MPDRATASAVPRSETPWALVHGFLGQPSSFAEIASRLDAPTVLVSLPGHGESPWFPDGSRFEDTCDAIAETLPPRVRLAGYSMGGRVALGIAAHHPERIERLVVIGAHPGLEDDGERLERTRWEADAAVRLRRDGLLTFVDAWEAMPLFATQHGLAAPQRERRRKERLAHTVEGLAWALEHLGLAVMPSHRAAIASFGFPTTLVSGALDTKQLALDEATIRVAQQVARVVVPRVGHDVVLEAPDVLLDVLRADAPA